MDSMTELMLRKMKEYGDKQSPPSSMVVQIAFHATMIGNLQKWNDAERQAYIDKLLIEAETLGLK